MDEQTPAKIKNDHIPPTAGSLVEPLEKRTYEGLASDLETAPDKTRDSVFNTDRNCWRISKACHAAMLVDCANYYKALHHAFSKAKHSIFILGWDIDSRIELLRGEDAENSALPVEAGALIGHLARQNPDLNVYLLRWDFSVAFMKERELLPKTAWKRKTPDNVQIVMDGTIPVGGSHHQKVIVIDDEVAFMGGMDIALERWDERDHRPHNPHRHDPRGVYGPYHDIGMMLTGPVVNDLAELCRWRWHYATGENTVPVRVITRDPVKTMPEAWDGRFDPDFTDIKVALTRTVPDMEYVDPVREVKTMYFDLIEQAQNFIYIENQFPIRVDIAKALNEKARQNPDLKIIIVSSYSPQGVFEKEAMWAARINFKNILMDGLDHEQVRMIYPLVNDDEGNPHYPRIHSKILVIDDDYMIVGSSNLNNRSFELDTECDLVLQARTDKQRADIRAVRDDLLAEHIDGDAREIGDMIARGAAISTIIKSTNGTPAQSQKTPAEDAPIKEVREIDDTIFTDQNFTDVARYLADPDHPLIPSLVPDRPTTNPNKRNILLGMAGLTVLAIAGYLLFQKFGYLITPETVTDFLKKARGTPWALPLTCLIYMIGGLILFPVTVMTLGTAMVFGAVLGPIYALAGALCSAALMFWIGHFMGRQGLRKLMGRKLLALDERLRENGVIGMTMIRMIPLAPYSIINLVGGISSIRFFDFIAGTFLGLLPGAIAKGVIGDSLTQILLSPTPETMLYLGAGIILWAALVAGSQYLVRQWQNKNKADKERTQEQKQTQGQTKKQQAVYSTPPS